MHETGTGTGDYGVNPVAMMLSLIVGAALYDWLLSRARLVPRWLSGSGFIGLAFAMVASLLVMSRLIEVVTPVYLSLMAVLGLQQMALAAWLIVRGLDTDRQVQAIRA